MPVLFKHLWLCGVQMVQNNCSRLKGRHMQLWTCVTFHLACDCNTDMATYMAEAEGPGVYYESRQRSFQVCLAWGSIRENLEVTNGHFRLDACWVWAFSYWLKVDIVTNVSRFKSWHHVWNFINFFNASWKTRHLVSASGTHLDLPVWYKDWSDTDTIYQYGDINAICNRVVKDERLYRRKRLKG